MKVRMLRVMAASLALMAAILPMGPAMALMEWCGGDPVFDVSHGQVTLRMNATV